MKRIANKLDTGQITTMNEHAFSPSTDKLSEKKKKMQCKAFNPLNVSYTVDGGRGPSKNMLQSN